MLPASSIAQSDMVSFTPKPYLIYRNSKFYRRKDDKLAINKGKKKKKKVFNSCI